MRSISFFGRRLRLRRYSKLEGNQVKICLEAEDTCLLGSDTTSYDGGGGGGVGGDRGPHSDTEDLVRDDTSSCADGGGHGHINGGLVSSSSESSDFSDHHPHQHVLEFRSTRMKTQGSHSRRHECCLPANHLDEDGGGVGDENVKFEQDFECDVHLGGDDDDDEVVVGADDADGAQNKNLLGGGGGGGSSGGGSTDEEEKKEFSFTFYDLDGHGKITKDDIAGLVRSIYGAVNDSITVPQGGKKTIKVRLTVSPEQQQLQQQQQQQQQQQKSKLTSQESTKNKLNNNEYEEIINAGTILGERENVNNNTSINNRQLLENSQAEITKLRNNRYTNILRNHSHRNSKVRFSSPSPNNNNNANNNNNNNETHHVSSKSNLDRFLKLNTTSSPCGSCRQHQQKNGDGGDSSVPLLRRHRTFTSAPSTKTNPEVLLHDYSGGTPMKHRKKWRERFSDCCRPPLALGKPQLFDLLQANMEKNNVSPCCRLDYSKLELQNNYRYSHSQSQNSSPAHHLCTHNHLIDPKCPILPLLNNNVVEQPSGGCPVAKIKNNNNNNTHYYNNSSNSNNNKHHHRSRSHDISHQNLFTYQLLEQHQHQQQQHQLRSSSKNTKANTCKCSTNIANNNYHHHHQEESIEILTAAAATTLNSGCAAAAASPKRYHHHHQKNTNQHQIHHHQLKHRNREQEHKRSMAQVISWLEREGLGFRNYTTTSSSNGGGAGLDDDKLHFLSSNSPRKNLFSQQQQQQQCNYNANSCPNSIDATSSESPKPIKKHHHHVHEHIHHHYHHHYGNNNNKIKETPIIV